MSGLFDTFNIAKRGLNVQQNAINTTSHNLANLNTKGYSRQRAVAETTKPFGGMSKYDSCSVGQIGTGAEITSIQRIRDSFIDYQIRDESGTYSYYTSKSDTLTAVEKVFGEPSDKGIEELTTTFFSAFQEVAKPNASQDVKATAIKQATALADRINYTYNQLKKTSDDCQKVLDTNVTEVNSYLNQINELNKQIRGVSAVGQTPNDLMDKRDNLLDEVSNKFGIKIKNDELDTITLSSTEYLDNTLVKSSPSDESYTRFSYVKGATALKDNSGNLTGEVQVDYYPLGNEKAVFQSFKVSAAASTDTDVAKKTQALVDNLTQNRVLMGDKDGLVGTDSSVTVTARASDTASTVVASDGTITTVRIEAGKKTTTTTTPPTSVSALNGKVFKTYKYDTDTNGTALNSVNNTDVKGEIAANQSVQDDIKGMMESLDRLAEALAYSVNAIQTGSIDPSKSSQGLNNTLIFVTDASNSTNTKSDKGITAKNLRINSDLKDPTKLNCNTTSASGDGDGKRAAAIANLSTLKMNISKIGSDEDLTQMTRDTFLKLVGIDSTTPFSDKDTCLNLNSGTDGSTVDSYFKTIINNLAVETNEANEKVDNQETILSNLDDQKSQVSGVSLNDETTDLIQFQHAYQANAKMIATIDELLDVVINGLKK